MRYRLNKLIYGPVGGVQTENLDRGPTWFDDELKVSHLRGEFVFTRTNENVLVDGVVETAVDVQCVRSLEFFTLPIQIKLESVPFGVPSYAPPDDEVAANDPDRLISSDSWIDLTDTLREEVIFAIPINPVHPKYAGENPPPMPDGMDEAETEDDWLHIKWNNPNHTGNTAHTADSGSGSG
jgi:uncharacterized metal-binding protein YceD (DUF177 family)